MATLYAGMIAPSESVPSSDVFKSTNGATTWQATGFVTGPIGAALVVASANVARAGVVGIGLNGGPSSNLYVMRMGAMAWCEHGCRLRE